MSIFDKTLFGDSKYETALKRIRTFCAGKRTLIAFSGGKDSQACYHLAKLAGVDFSAQLSITRFEPPEILNFVRRNYPDVVFRRAYKRSLIDDIEHMGLPTRFSRWCCAAKHIRTPGIEIAVIGVRAAESPRRAKRWQMFGYKPDKTAYVCPIIDWTEADVWEFLGAVHAPHCVLYDQGFRRIGCTICPLATSQMKAHAARYPKFCNALKIGAGKFCDRMRRAGYVTKTGARCPDWCEAQNPADEYFTRWIETGQTGKRLYAADTDDCQPCLFDGTGFSENDAPPV